MAFAIRNGSTVNLILSGDNTLKSGNYFAGVEVTNGNTLIISGTGSLTATSKERSPGIGGSYLSADAGNITIHSGTVTATGGGVGSAGIGGAAKGAGGTIKITGGTVTATSVGGAGIGIGRDGSVAGSTTVITGGSINATSITPHPTSAGDIPVYLNTLTLGNPAVGDGISISALEYDTGFSYDVNNVVTASGGKVYIWLPQNISSTAAVTVTAGGTSYSKTYTRDSAEQAYTLLVNAPDVTFPEASAVTFGQALAGSALSGGTPERGAFAWADDSIVPAVINSGYTVVFTPNDLENYDYSAVSGWDSTTQTVRRTVGITVTMRAPGYTDATIKPAGAEFDRYAGSAGHRDIAVTLNSGSYSLAGIQYEGRTLIPGIEYTVSGSQYIFSRTFLASLDVGSHIFAFSMSGAVSPAFTVTVENSTPAPVPAPAPIPASNTDSPQTGDNGGPVLVWLWVLIFALLAGGVAGTVLWRRKRRAGML